MVELALVLPLLLVALLGTWSLVTVMSAQADAERAATVGVEALAQTDDPPQAVGAAQRASRFGTDLRVSTDVRASGALRIAEVRTEIRIPTPAFPLVRVGAVAVRPIEVRR